MLVFKKNKEPLIELMRRARIIMKWKLTKTTRRGGIKTNPR